MNAYIKIFAVFVLLLCSCTGDEKGNNVTDDVPVSSEKLIHIATNEQFQQLKDESDAAEKAKQTINDRRTKSDEKQESQKWKSSDSQIRDVIHSKKPDKTQYEALIKYLQTFKVIFENQVVIINQSINSIDSIKNIYKRTKDSLDVLDSVANTSKDTLFAYQTKTQVFFANLNTEKLSLNNQKKIINNMITLFDNAENQCKDIIAHDYTEEKYEQKKEDLNQTLDSLMKSGNDYFTDPVEFDYTPTKKPNYKALYEEKCREVNVKDQELKEILQELAILTKENAQLKKELKQFIVSEIAFLPIGKGKVKKISDCKLAFKFNWTACECSSAQLFFRVFKLDKKEQWQMINQINTNKFTLKGGTEINYTHTDNFEAGEERYETRFLRLLSSFS